MYSFLPFLYVAHTGCLSNINNNYTLSIPAGGIIILRSCSHGGERDPVSEGALWGSVNLSQLDSPLSLVNWWSRGFPGPLKPN